MGEYRSSHRGARRRLIPNVWLSRENGETHISRKMNALQDDDFTFVAAEPASWTLNVGLVVAVAVLGMLAGLTLVDGNLFYEWLVAAGGLGIIFGVCARILWI